LRPKTSDQIYPESFEALKVSNTSSFVLIFGAFLGQAFAASQDDSRAQELLDAQQKLGRSAAALQLLQDNCPEDAQVEAGLGVPDVELKLRQSVPNLQPFEDKYPDDVEIQFGLASRPSICLRLL
jgi:hypothetical protein